MRVVDRKQNDGKPLQAVGVKRLRGWHGCAGAGLLAIVLGVSLLTPGRGVAQEIFGSIVRMLGAADDRYPRDDRYPALFDRSEPFAYASPSDVPKVRRPARLTPDEPDRTSSAEPAGRSSYCVRLCDGRFFPLSGPAASSAAAATKMCSAMCPASRTAIYYGSKIDDATAGTGERYADLANAYVYRDAIVPDCTCNGKDALGLAPIDIANDPTLRPGDVVATTAGLKVFKGATHGRHRTADFTPVGRTSRLSADIRRKLATMRVATSPRAEP
jgi:hypothetical protein